MKSEYVWTFNGYRVCKRKRVQVDKDRAGKNRVRKCFGTLDIWIACIGIELGTGGER